jgi:signal transduction histidine kinase
MMKMTEFLKGRFSINSTLGIGTKILITIPNRTLDKEVGDAAI